MTLRKTTIMKQKLFSKYILNSFLDLLIILPTINIYDRVSNGFSPQN